MSLTHCIAVFAWTVSKATVMHVFVTASDLLNAWSYFFLRLWFVIMEIEALRFDCIFGSLSVSDCTVHWALLPDTDFIVHTEGQQQMSAFNTLLDFELTGTLEMQYTSLCNQMITWGTTVRRLHWLPLIHEWWLLDRRLTVFTVCVWHCPMTSATCGHWNWWDPVALRLTGKMSLALRHCSLKWSGLTAATLALSMSSTALWLPI